MTKQNANSEINCSCVLFCENITSIYKGIHFSYGVLYYELALFTVVYYWYNSIYNLVGVAQLVERQFVVLNVAGSSPVTHPKMNDRNNLRLCQTVLARHT